MPIIAIISKIRRPVTLCIIRYIILYGTNPFTWVCRTIGTWRGLVCKTGLIAMKFICFVNRKKIYEQIGEKYFYKLEKNI